MTEITVNLACGHNVPFTVDTDRQGPAYFALGIRKCGSSLFNKLVIQLTRMNGRNFVDIGERYFKSNIVAKDWIRDPANRGVLYGGNVYGGFREMPAAFEEAPLYIDGKKILMVRDPRDALVSEYFSNAYSHGIPKRTDNAADITNLLEKLRQEALHAEIDDWVVDRAASLRNAFMGYKRQVGLPSLIVVKYEEYIFDKPALIRLIARNFDMKVSDVQITQIMGWADVRPQQEVPTQFIRRVTPGDHREKLKPETIAKLNNVLKPAMDAFGYSPT